MKTTRKIKAQTMGGAFTAFVLFAGFLLLLFICTLNYWRNNFWVLLTFWVNAILFLTMFFKTLNKHAFSLQLIFWIFMFFFMFFAPYIQYAYNSFPWNTTISDGLVAKINVILFVFGVIVALATPFKFNKKAFPPRLTLAKPKISKTGIYILVLINIAITILAINKNGIAGLIANRSEGGNKFIFTSYQPINLITSTFVPGFVVFSYIYTFLFSLRSKSSPKRYFLLLAASFCLILCNFPLATARYAMATFYIAIMIIVLQAIRTGIKFSFVFIGGLIIIFPLIEAFRYGGLLEVDLKISMGHILANFFRSYTQGHYDAYAMFANTIYYVEGNGPTLGRQLFGALLFFVPRSIWANKPLSSGATIFTYFGHDFTNVSCPLIGEMYINFGLVGVLIGAIFFGKIIKTADKRFWQNNYLSVNKTFYLLSISLLFFMLRGDMMSSFAYSMSYYMSCRIVSFIAVKPCATLYNTRKP